MIDVPTVDPMAPSSHEFGPPEIDEYVENAWKKGRIA